MKCGMVGEEDAHKAANSCLLVSYVGTVSAVLDSENNRKLTFELPEEDAVQGSTWMKYVMPKGYIAVNGCSLTIGEVQGRTFSGVLGDGKGGGWRRRGTASWGLWGRVDRREDLGAGARPLFHGLYLSFLGGCCPLKIMLPRFWIRANPESSQMILPHFRIRIHPPPLPPHSHPAVYLIPETLRVTVFGGISVGDKVNVEIETQTQAIVDTTERVVAAYLARTKA